MAESLSLPDAAVAELAQLLRTARDCVVFTGAGISTESGIPDFRSPGGIWNRYQPINFQTFLASDDAKREYWRRGRATYAVIQAAEPNPAHRAVAAFERAGIVSLVITQNIDGLHQRAGTPSEQLIELHGTAHRIYCMNCGAEESRAALIARLDAGEDLPTCCVCGGVLRSATVAFGEQLDSDLLRRAMTAAQSCDLFLVLGSSLVVQPAAVLPQLAVEAGATLVILNQTATPLDALAQLIIREPVGAVLAAVRAQVLPGTNE